MKHRLAAQPAFYDYTEAARRRAPVAVRATGQTKLELD
jgi:hypothetical protein